MTDQEWLRRANSFDMGRDSRFGDIVITSRRQRDGSLAWVVYNGASTLNNEDGWEYEPLPSSRDDEYLARTRVKTKEEALERLEDWRAQRPAR